MKRAMYWLLTLLLASVFTLSACQSAQPIKTEEIYRVVTSASAPPFTYMDNKNTIVGYDIDLMNSIAEKSGFTVEYENLDWPDLTKDMDHCEQNTIYISAMAPVTFKEKTNCYDVDLFFYDGVVWKYLSSSEQCTTKKVPVYFSKAYFTSGSVVIVRTENSDILSYTDLKEKKVACIVGTLDHRSPPYSDMDLMLLEQDTALKALMEKKVDALVVGYAPAMSFVDQFNGNIKIVGSPFTSDRSFAIGVCDRKGDNELLDRINLSLDALQADGTLKNLNTRWLKGQ